MEATDVPPAAIELPLGTVVLTGPWKGGSLIQRLIMFFGESWISHGLMRTFPENGVESITEAGGSVHKVPWKRYTSDPNARYMAYRLTEATEEEVSAALLKAYDIYSGESYAYLQLVWFVYRWFCEKTGLKLVWIRNFFPQDVECIEYVGDVLSMVNDRYAAAMKELPFDLNCTLPRDIEKLMKDHPELFELVESH